MRRAVLIGAAFVTATSLASIASADPWKDESRNHPRRNDNNYGHDRGGEWRDDRRANNRIPRGHLPPPGMCRVWFDARPAGHQPAPMSCQRAERLAARSDRARVVDSRGRSWGGAYAAGDYGGHNSGREYDGRRESRDGYGYTRVCDAYNSAGACVRTRLVPR